MYKRVQKTGKNLYSGVTALAVIVVLAFVSVFVVGASYGILALKHKGLISLDFTNFTKTLTSQSAYLNSDKVNESFIKGNAVGTVSLPDGSFSAYKIISGDVAGGEPGFTKEAKLGFLSGDEALGVYSDGIVSPFYLSDGTKTTGVILDSMIIAIDHGATSYAIKVLSGTVQRGKLVGNFIGQTYDLGYIIAGTATADGRITDAKVNYGGYKTSEAQSAIALNALSLFNKVAEAENPKVLAASTTAVANYRVIGNNKPAFNSSTGTWSFGTSPTSTGIVSTSPSQSLVNYVQNVTQAAQQNAAGGNSSGGTVGIPYPVYYPAATTTTVINGIKEVKSGSSYLGVSNSNGVVTLSLSLPSSTTSTTTTTTTNVTSLASNTVNSSNVVDYSLSAQDLSSSLSFGSGQLLDLSAISYTSSGQQGLRLPITSSTPANPAYGKGYIAYDSINNQIIQYNGTSWQAVGSGVGSGISLVQEGDISIVSSANTLDFLGSDFTVSQSPTGEANISIDYSNSNIVRSNQTQSITGTWSFPNGLVLGTDTISDIDGSGLALVTGVLKVSGLTTANFASPNISQFTNNSAYITGVSWGGITGTLTNQGDLKTALDAKADVSSLGTLASQNSNNVSITGGSLSGLTSVGATSFSGALTGDVTGNVSGNAGTVTNGVYTNGSYSNPSWITSVAPSKVLPDQTGNNGKILGTNGTTLSWVTNSSGVAWGAITGTLSNQSDLNTALGLKYDSTNFIAGTNYLAPTGSAASLTDFPTLNQNTTGTASNITGVLGATSFPAMAGDVTNTQGSLTNAIASGAVTLAKMANLAANSIIGNNTGISATPIALTTSQVKTLLSISTGDVSGLGTIASQASNNVSITGGSLSGLTSVGATTFTGALTGDVTGNVSGNAGTATKLATSRTIAGTSFDGSANITLSNKFIIQGTSDSGLTGAQFLGSLGNGILKNTTTTGVLSIAEVGDFPTLNQNTTGTASNITGVLGATSFPAMAGDVTNTQGSLTNAIASGAVTLSKMANLAANSIIGNNTGVSATPIALTATQVKTLLGISTGDVSGLGTISTQNSNSVNITGGSLSGLTSVGATTFTGALTGDVTGNVSGNAGTVTNGVYSNGSYSDPGWITSISPAKVLPDQTGNGGKVLGTNGSILSWVTNSSGVAWGAITGTLSDQSDLNTALGLKFNSSSFTDAAVTGKVLTGYTSGAGTVAATDTILQAIQKLNGNEVLNYDSGNFVAGTNYLAPNGSAASLTDFPTLNQNTTGTASNITGVLGSSSFPAMTGDVTNTQGSLTTAIASGAVTLAKMANLAANSIIGNNTGVSATPIALSASQVKTLLAISNSDVSGLGTMSTQNANGVTITGGSVAGLTGLGIRSTGTGAFDLTIANTENLTAGRTLTITLGNSARTLTLTGDASIAGTSSGTNTGDNAANSNYASDYRAANFIAGTNYLAPTGSAASLTDFPTLNQNTTGTASNITGVLGATSFPAMAGDVTNTQGSLTNAIASGAVTLAKMANLAANSIIGNNTGVSATPIALTVAQVKTLLAIATGDVSGLGTIATQASNSVALTGGSIDGITIGGSTAGAGTFTTLTANTSITRGTDTITDFTGNGLTLSTGSLTLLTPTATDALSATTSNGSGLEVLTGGIALLQGCSDGQILKWTESSDTWSCQADNTSAGGGISTVKEGGASIVTSAVSLNYAASDFVVTDETGGQSGIAIDYTNSHITRDNQTQTISGAWAYTNDITLNAQNDIRFADSDSSNWVAFQAPGTVSSNVTWTLPSADANGCLKSNGSGTLSIDPACGETDRTTFTSNSTYTKKTNALLVVVEAWGPGGGGGGGGSSAAGTADTGGGAGGGGAYVSKSIDAASVGATETVTVPAGGNGGNGGTGGAGTNGSVATSDTTFGALVTAYKGGGGAKGNASTTGGGGGGGGGSTSAGASTTGATGGAGGNPGGGAAGAVATGSGGGGGGTTTAGSATYGGGGGGGLAAGGTAGRTGGHSLYGGGGGGGGGSNAATHAGTAGGAGGSSMGVNGGTAGSNAGGAGGAGNAGTNFYGGSGGGGGGSSTAGAGGLGGAGGAPGGGGGGGGGAGTNTLAGGNGGAGARGEVRVWTYRGTGADLAESYSTNDSSIESGDIVAIDSNLRAGVKKSSTAYDPTAIGIVSTQPGLVMGTVLGEGTKTVLVALSGRVPVKVNKENGDIAAGDYLTPSSEPGVAMKATKAGIIIGQALGNYDGTTPGYVMAFVKNGFGQGINLANGATGQKALENIMQSTTTDMSNISLINTDRIVAGVEVVTPNLISDSINTRALTITGQTQFLGNVEFTITPLFNSDMAGFAVIKKGDKEVEIGFDKEYLSNPIVSVSPVWDVDSATLDVVKELGTYILPKQDYIITNSSSKGFSIILDQPAVTDLKFSWIAVSVKDAKTVLSASDSESETEYLPSPSPSPTPSPTPIPTIEPVSELGTEELPSPSPATELTVNSPVLGYVRLRDIPSSIGEILGQIPDKTKIPFLDQNEGWYKVVFDGQTGWVSGEYIQIE